MKHSTMKLGLTAALIIGGFTVVAQRPLAAQASPVAGAVAGQVSQWKGVVTSVNQKTRGMVVKGPNGKQHSFTVPESVPGLSNVKVGDTLTVDYVEAIGVSLRKATDPPVAGTTSAVTVAPTGKPAVAGVQVKEVQGNVTAVNHTTRMLTLKGPQGNSWTVQIDPSVASFSSVKVGDQVVLSYTQALAVTVTK